MTKKELLDLILMANKAEEDMVANLAKNMTASLEWFKGTKEEAAILRDGLKKISKESASHADMLAALRKKIEKDGKDVY